MQELCPRMLEESYLHPQTEIEIRNKILIEACKKIRELGGPNVSHFNCPDCQVVMLKRRSISSLFPLED